MHERPIQDNIDRDLQLIGETPNPDDEETGRNISQRSVKQVDPFSVSAEVIEEEIQEEVEYEESDDNLSRKSKKNMGETTKPAQPDASPDAPSMGFTQTFGGR